MFELFSKVRVQSPRFKVKRLSYNSVLLCMIKHVVLTAIHQEFLFGKYTSKAITTL